MSQRISQFTQIVTLASGDYFPVVQTSGTTNKAVQVGALDQRYFVVASGNKAQSTADSALSSGNAALVSAASAQASGNAAQASGNAALSRAGGTMTGPIVFAAGQQINSSVNLSGGISGAVPYQSAPSSTTFLSPGVSGQVLTTAGSNQAPTWATPGGGKILQAVQAIYTANYNTNATTFTAVGPTLSITPSSTSSRILLTTSYVLYHNNSNYQSFNTFTRNGTNISTNPTQIGITAFAPSAYGSVPCSFSYIDSPATTSAITYGIAIKTSSTGLTVTFNYDGFGSYDSNATLIALEIAP